MKMIPVPAHPGYYLSDDGNAYRRVDSGGMLKLDHSYDENDNPIVYLTDERGVTRSYSLRYLIAAYLLAPIPRGVKAVARNGNRRDCRASNIVFRNGYKPKKAIHAKA